jgi:hypothetical protein
MGGLRSIQRSRGPSLLSLTAFRWRLIASVRREGRKRRRPLHCRSIQFDPIHSTTHPPPGHHVSSALLYVRIRPISALHCVASVCFYDENWEAIHASQGITMCYLIKLLLGIFGCGFGLLNNSMGFCLGSENTSTREEKKRCDSRHVRPGS